MLRGNMGQRCPGIFGTQNTNLHCPPLREALWPLPCGHCLSAQAAQIALLYLKAKEENKPQPKEEAILALNKRNVFIPQ